MTVDTVDVVSGFSGVATTDDSSGYRSGVVVPDADLFGGGGCVLLL